MAEKERFTPVLMILCGIPACGKTYLANSIKEWGRHCKETEVHVVHICYDNLIPSDLDLKTSLKYDQKESLPCCTDHRDVEYSAWKHYRKLITQCVELIAKQNQNITLDLLEESNVNETTSCGLPSLQDFWEIFYKQTSGKEMSCSCLRTQKWVNTPHVLLIDDNMYYRSMRHDYFLLARKYGLGFMQVFIKCPLDAALKRNSKREEPVGRDTIITMADKQEPPLPDKYPWEMYSMTLNVNDVGSTSCLTQLASLMKQAASNPIQPLPEEDQQMKEKSRTANMVSILYQADQTLRRVISNRMAEAKGKTFSREKMRSLSEELNSKRKTFLEKLKSEEHNFMDLIDKMELSEREMTHDTSPGCKNKILTQLQNKEKFQENIKTLFDCFIKSVN